MPRNDAGVILLEVIVAITLLAVAGTAVVSLLSAAVRQQDLLARRETTMLTAYRTLAALTLLRRAELDRRLGRHPADRFIAEVSRPEPTLYRLALLLSDTASIEMLTTVVHRPDPKAP